MHLSLGRNQFLVKEQVGMLKASNNYDVFDPQTGQKVLECREPNLGIFSKIFRFTDYKRMTPFNIEIRTPEGGKVLSVKRGISLLFSKVEVLDENDIVVGYFNQKLFSIGGKFDVLNAQGTSICTLKGKWTSWDFRFVKGNAELAHVSKKWAGVGKELFTTADNYMLSISNAVGSTDSARVLIVAAVMCIDMVLKE
ncbi:phospholipid scramblase-related protein [Hydrogenophaga taeniospiralis]|nr:phospholipid scramblase-related protein [Hydrogenophaga taeniospiralis]